MDWPLPLDRVQDIVEHLITDGSRDGIILGDELNVAMGASARRRAKREHDHEEWMLDKSAKGGHYCRACGEHVTDPEPIYQPTTTEGKF
jgi:ABC-type nickel/cobalt efflux system permease component RcnA